MIKYRQKIFVLPALAPALSMGGKVLGGLGNAAMIASIPMGISQSKQQEELAEQQKEQNMQTVKALNNIAKQAAKNPETAQAAANVMSQAQERSYSVMSGLKTAGREVGLLGKNIGKIINKDNHVLVGGVLAGAGMTGASYLTDKVIQADMKRSGIKLPPATPQQKSYAALSLPGPVSKPGFFKKAGSVLKNAYNKNKGMIYMTAAIGSVPTALGYISQKQALKDQTAATESYPQQRSYSLFGKVGSMVKNAGNWAKSNWKEFNKHKTESILGGISNLSGGGGRRGVRRFGKQLQTLGRQSNSKLTKAAGDFIVDHPKTALIGSVPVGMGIMAATWDAGSKLVDKTTRKFDKNAYRYQDYMNQPIQE